MKQSWGHGARSGKKGSLCTNRNPMEEHLNELKVCDCTASLLDSKGCVHAIRQKTFGSAVCVHILDGNVTLKDNPKVLLKFVKFFFLTKTSRASRTLRRRFD